MSSLDPAHLKRYKDLALLLGRNHRLRAGVGDEGLPSESDGDVEDRKERADRLAADLEEMGPTFVKLGQLLSTRSDLLPPEYLEALSRLQDDVEPFPYEQVEEVVSRELGVRISKAFTRFDPEPIAAASLGQVHRATLRGGREVAVKVQRPGIRETIRDDLDALGEVAGVADDRSELGRAVGFERMIDEFRRSLMAELDYRQEARHLRLIGSNLAGIDRIVVPNPVDDYTTDRVLTMEWVSGRKITELSGLSRIDVDGGPLADALFEAYLQQILVDGVFHADPHPGNVFLTDDGRLALIDLGMVARLAPGLQDRLLKLLLALAEGSGDRAADAAREIGEPMRGWDEREFRRRVAALAARSRDLAVEEIEVGRVVLEVTRIAIETGVRVPQELTLLGKTLLNLDQVACTLDPRFDPNSAVQRHSSEIMQKRLLHAASPGNILSTIVETKEFMESLPARANRIVENLAENRMRVRVDAIDEVVLLEGLQKVANRITTGVVIAALIVGAAMLMRIETTFTILGYPGLAMIFFLLAAAAGVWLLYGIIVRDRHADPPDERAAP